MSHYTVGVFLKPGVTNIESAVDRALARYYEEDAYESGNEDDAKWDWYVIGGRWDGLLKLKNGKAANYAPIEDIDFNNKDKKLVDHYSRFWEIVVEGSPLRENEDPKEFIVLGTKEYFINKFKTKEFFIERRCSTVPYAFVDEDCNWFEPGQMGYFAISDDTFETNQKYLELFNKKMKESDPETILVIVDCHI